MSREEELIELIVPKLKLLIWKMAPTIASLNLAFQVVKMTLVSIQIFW